MATKNTDLSSDDVLRPLNGGGGSGSNGSSHSGSDKYTTLTTPTPPLNLNNATAAGANGTNGHANLYTALPTNGHASGKHVTWRPDTPPSPTPNVYTVSGR